RHFASSVSIHVPDHVEGKDRWSRKLELTLDDFGIEQARIAIDRVRAEVDLESPEGFGVGPTKKIDVAVPIEVAEMVAQTVEWSPTPLQLEALRHRVAGVGSQRRVPRGRRCVF